MFLMFDVLFVFRQQGQRPNIKPSCYPWGSLHANCKSKVWDVSTGPLGSSKFTLNAEFDFYCSVDKKTTKPDFCASNVWNN